MKLRKKNIVLVIQVTIEGIIKSQVQNSV